MSIGFSLFPGYQQKLCLAIRLGTYKSPHNARNTNSAEQGAKSCLFLCVLGCESSVRCVCLNKNITPWSVTEISGLIYFLKVSLQLP